MTYEQAEILGLKALAYMAAREEIMAAYLRLTGITAGHFRESATTPATLGSILDYFLQNEKRLVIFCQEEDIVPKQIATARQFLPGGEIMPDSL